MGRVDTTRRAAAATRSEASRPYARPLSPIPPVDSAPLSTQNSSPSSYGAEVGTALGEQTGLTDNGDGTYSLEPDEFGSYPGFPSISEYEDIQENYLKNLSSRKQEKALITQAMYDSIYAVLMDPSNTSHGTPQFRFWVRKMFVLACFQGDYTVTHEEKPVAAKEQIYQILVHCHGECYHGGRDKTCSQIKQYYSWIPKELVAQFVKACPTCVLKRSNNPRKFVAMLKDIGGATGTDEEYIDYFTSPIRNAPRFEAKNANSQRKPRPPPLVFDNSFSSNARLEHAPSSALYTPDLFEDNALQVHQQFRRSSAGGLLDPSSAASSQINTPLTAEWSFGAGGPYQTFWAPGDASVYGGGNKDVQNRPTLAPAGRHYSYSGAGSSGGGTYSLNANFMAPSMAHSVSEGNRHPYPSPYSTHFPATLSSQVPSPYHSQFATAPFVGDNIGAAGLEGLDVSAEGALLAANDKNPFDVGNSGDGEPKITGHELENPTGDEVKVEESQGY